MLDVIWKSYNSPTCFRTQWDMALLEDSLTAAGARHHLDFHSDIHSENVGIVLSGQHQRNYISKINADLSCFEKVIIFIVGDEENLFPIRQIEHPNVHFFIQTPKPNQYDDCEKLLVGYPPIIYKPKIEKTHEWFFAGQVTHIRRFQCVEVLKTLPDFDRGLIETAGFTQGISRVEYLNRMAAAKIIPCPSGICSPDSFRFAEALECGCVPVVDGRSPRNGYEGFWNYVLGENLPFPVINDWNDFPRVLYEELDKWPLNAEACSSWWKNYKNNLVEKFKCLSVN